MIVIVSGIEATTSSFVIEKRLEPEAEVNCCWPPPALRVREVMPLVIVLLLSGPGRVSGPGPSYHSYPARNLADSPLARQADRYND